VWWPFSRAACECEATRPGKRHSLTGRQPQVPGYVSAGRLLNPQASQTKGSGWTGRYLLLSAGYGLDRSSSHEEE